METAIPLLHPQQLDFDGLLWEFTIPYGNYNGFKLESHPLVVDTDLIKGLVQLRAPNYDLTDVTLYRNGMALYNLNEHAKFDQVVYYYQITPIISTPICLQVQNQCPYHYYFTLQVKFTRPQLSVFWLLTY